MKVAVLTLTRDRLPYTAVCFDSLQRNAGCEYDHYVLDQGSVDGTREWLTERHELFNEIVLMKENIGICRGLNFLMDQVFDPDEYDVIVKFDNDCELLSENTVLECSTQALDKNMILSPRIHGLRSPPERVDALSFPSGVVIDVYSVIGGIFMATPAAVFQSDGFKYRHSDKWMVWQGDDSTLCRWFQGRGGKVGYVRGREANHYRTTDGQHTDYPEYFHRRVLEGGPV